MSQNKNIINSTLFWGAVIYFIINLIQAWFSPVIDDEAYYFVWSQKLDFGYFDHPPMIAWWDAIGFFILQNQLGLRLITAFFASLGYFLLGNFLISDKKEIYLFNLLFFSFILFEVFSFISTPDAPLLFFSIFYLITLSRFIQKQNWINTILLGMSMALVTYSKYHGLLLISFSLLPLISHFYKEKKAYISILIALILYSPHLFWQYNHDFITINYHLVRRNVHGGFEWENPTKYIGSIIYISSPFLFYYLIKPFLKFPKILFHKSLWFIFWLSILFFFYASLSREIQDQWSLITFIPLFILSFDYLKNKKSSFVSIKILSIITISLLILCRIYFMLPNPPIKIKYHGWEEFMKKAAQATKGNAIFDSYQNTSLYSFYNYPQKAYIYISNESRESQYHIWNDIREINGEPFTFFSENETSNDSLAIHSSENYFFKYISGEKFADVSAFWFKIENSKIKENNLILNGFLVNSSNKKRTLSPKNHKINIVFAKEKFSNEKSIEIYIPINDFQLNPYGKKPFKFIIPLKKKYIEGMKIAYLNLAPLKFDGVIRSNYIKFANDEND